MNKSQTSFLAGGDPYLAPFSSMTDGQLRDPKQLVGLARACLLYTSDAADEL